MTGPTSEFGGNTRWLAKRHRPRVSPLEMVDRAAGLLRRVGFVHHETSRKSNAVYYRWPDRPYLLRLADHKGTRQNNGHPENHLVCARLTFAADKHHDGLCVTTTQALESSTAAAIGRYFLKSSERMADE